MSSAAKKKNRSEPAVSKDDPPVHERLELPHSNRFLLLRHCGGGSPANATNSPTPILPRRSIAETKVRARSKSPTTDNPGFAVRDNEERPVAQKRTTTTTWSSLARQLPRPSWFVCHTAAQTAESLRTHSFAVLQGDTGLSESLRTAVRTFRECLELQEQRQQHDGNRRAWPRVIDVNGNGLGLMGYNVPSPSKIVFRAYPHHPRQPWPTDDDHRDSPKLQNVSLNVAARLRDVLLQCLQELWHGPSQDDSLTEGEGGKDAEVEEAALKRPRSMSPPEDDEVPTQASHARAIPPPYGCCPLDYYYYHNRGPDTVPNCTEHVDRGLLIAVCLTDVPGLEVRMHSNSTTGHDHREWMCPEEALLQPGWDAPGGLLHPPAYVAILAGDALQDHLPLGVPTIPACVHRVRHPLTAPRLSICYELRP